MLVSRAVSALLAVLMAQALRAEPLPAPDAMPALLGRPPVEVSVRNPHNTLGEAAPVVRLLGFAAADVLDALLGPAWRQGGASVQFRAADGYVSAVPVERFLGYPAWLVHARADGGAFVTDNAFQGRREVPLGPWYLVWDNIRYPELIPLGDHFWPYQVTEVRAVAASAGQGEAP